MKVIQFIRVNHLFNRVAFSSAAGLLLLATLLCLPISNNKLETKATPGTAQESSITMNFTSSIASVDLTVNSTDGTFATSNTEDKAAFSVTTNNYTGYTLSISAPDDTGTLLNGSNSLDSISSNLTEAEFNTASNNGKWGYKPNKFYASNEVVDNTGTNAVFLSSPTTEATTLDVTNTANNEANEYDIALGARTDYSKPNGTYSKTFVLTAVANKINYSVTYNANAGTDTVTNMPYESTNNVQSGDTNSTSITLSDLVPVRDGYIFVGWCSIATSDETCSGTTYNPNGTYGINKTTINTAELYARWKYATLTYQFFVEYTSTLGNKKGLIQSEVENYYTEKTKVNTQTRIRIKKNITEPGYTNFGGPPYLYIDGKIYLGAYGTETISGEEYFYYDITMDDAALYTLTVKILAKPSLQIFKDEDCGIAGYDPRYSESDTMRSKMENVETVLIDGLCWTGSIYPTGTLDSTNTNLASGSTYKVVKGTSTTYVTGQYDEDHGTYNYCAASAGTICTEGTDSNLAQYDICPKGWRLPNASEISGPLYTLPYTFTYVWSSEPTIQYSREVRNINIDMVLHMGSVQSLGRHQVHV